MYISQNNYIFEKMISFKWSVWKWQKSSSDKENNNFGCLEVYSEWEVTLEKHWETAKKHWIYFHLGGNQSQERQCRWKQSDEVRLGD